MIGRIVNADLNFARCEFTAEVKEGDHVSFKRRQRSGGGEVVCRVERLETTSFGGLRGWIVYLEPIDSPPRNMTEIYRHTKRVEKGILEIGENISREPIRMGVNPLFNHLMVAGMTGRGKTHFMIVLLEELIEHGVPCLVFDPQGEFVNFPEIYKNAVVVENTSMPDLIAHLQRKHTVIINLLGLPKISKAMHIGDILEQFTVEKERDYQQAENDVRRLKIPPTLIFIDEAEEYAPHQYSSGGTLLSKVCLSAIIDIAKRGTKFGIGLIIASQRPPKMDVDVRSQCNSLIAFRMTDAGSHYTIGRQDVLTKLEVRRISKLDIGQCLLTGKITISPRVLTVRDINVRRAKKMDFEEILGIKEGPDHFEFKTTIKEDENGDLIHEPSGTVIATIEKRVAEQDKLIVEQDDGDGVILRDSHLSPEDQKLLRKLRTPDEKGDD